MESHNAASTDSISRLQAALLDFMTVFFGYLDSSHSPETCGYSKPSIERHDCVCECVPCGKLASWCHPPHILSFLGQILGLRCPCTRSVALENGRMDLIYDIIIR